MASSRHIKEEKRKRDGKNWNKEELIKVCKLYFSEKTSIHENNPAIQELAKKLERGTRAVEAQMQMFRNLERKGNYSRGKMNKLCREVWQEMVNKKNEPVSSQDCDSPQHPFPEAFFAWAGSRNGAVKRPFDDDSGRPTKSEIQTNLVIRLKEWAKAITNNDNQPRAIFLVGGPGNGKTDAIESCVHSIDAQLNLSGSLIKQFSTAFAKHSGMGLLPRKVLVNANVSKYKKIALVQDATVKDPELKTASAEKLFLDDLDELVNGSPDFIYLCCVNRGILAQAISLAHNSGVRTEVLELLNKISTAVTVQYSPIDAWPLQGYPEIAVWPMDIESLVDPSVYSSENTPAHQILEKATCQHLWRDHSHCNNRDICPFAQNHDQLTRPAVRDNLVSLLHYYELASGKRWSFRDIFALISHLMVGPENSYRIGSKTLSPCEWVKKQCEFVSDDSISGKQIQQAKAIYVLNSKLYHHVLFSRWPKLGKLRYAYNRKLSKHFARDDSVKGFFNFLSSHRPDTSTPVTRIIQGSFSDLLDPVASHGSLLLFQGGKLTINDIEEAFSHSIKLGRSKFARYLLESEKLLLEKLQNAEVFIDNQENVKKVEAKKLRQIKNSIKAFACRLVKRSIGVRNGICKNKEELLFYLSVLSDKQMLMRLRRELEELVNTGNRFEMSLITTFGQPAPSVIHDAILQAPQVTIQPIEYQHSETHPMINLRYFHIKNHPIPITFNLFLALHNSANGMHMASLPRDIFAMLDSTKARVVGSVVRDQEMLFQAEIKVGNTGEKILHELGDFIVRRKEQS